MQPASGNVVRFGPFALDSANMELRKLDRRIRLRPQACTLLLYLSSRPGELVTRDELQRTLWSNDTFVDFEHGINFCIRQIRHALGESATSPRFIETVPRRGYRFVPESRAIQSIAVLPFKNVSRDPALEYLADGISEGLIRKLAAIPTLRVPAWSSVSRLKSSAGRRGLARRLGVGALLSGKVARFQGQVEVSVDLVDSGDLELWGRQYRFNPQELVNLQPELLFDIARVLRLETPQERAGRAGDGKPASIDSYHCYLKGRYYLNKSSEDGLQRAILHFNEAIEFDPLHALAFTGLAECYGALAFFGFLAPHESYPKAKAAALKALQIDDSIPEAHACLGMAALFYDWTPVEALGHCRRAIEFGRSSPAGYRWQSSCLIAMARHEEALASAQKALELDPLSAPAQILISYCYHFARRYEESVKAARKALEIDPNHAEAHRFLGISLVQLNDLEEATSELEVALRMMGATPATLGSLGRVYARAGRIAEALAIIQRLKVLNQTKGVAAGALAAVYTGLGDNDQALEWLVRSVANRSSWMGFLNVEPWWDPIRKYREFHQLLNTVYASPVDRDN